VTYVVKKSWITFVLATTLVGLSGCAGNNDNAANNNANMNNAANMGDNNPINGVNVKNVSNQNLRVSGRAINNVERLKEVDQANVIIRNNDAYVAISLNNNQNGNRAHGGTIGTAPNMNATYGNGYNSGTTSTNGTVNMNASTGPGTNGTRNNARGTNTNNTSSLDRKIINQVRAADRSIDNVYVSYDTNTFGQMTNFSNDIRNGTNRDGLWNDFTNSVDRMFR
jgi:hypothetical protein